MANMWRTAPSTVSQPKLSWFLETHNAEVWPTVMGEFFDAAAAPPNAYSAGVVIRYYYKLMSRR